MAVINIMKYIRMHFANNVSLERIRIICPGVIVKVNNLRKIIFKPTSWADDRMLVYNRPKRSGGNIYDMIKKCEEKVVYQPIAFQSIKARDDEKIICRKADFKFNVMTEESEEFCSNNLRKRTRPVVPKIPLRKIGERLRIILDKCSLKIA